jgi:hypothetical protein
MVCLSLYAFFFCTSNVKGRLADTSTKPSYAFSFTTTPHLRLIVPRFGLPGSGIFVQSPGKGFDNMPIML